MRTELERRLERLERLSDAGAMRAPLDPLTVNCLRATGYMDYEISLRVERSS
jgi:hypothetical protein